MGHLTLIELASYGVVSFGTAILSGIAGGGAGFINAPLLILFGLSPAQAITTGKLTGLSVATSSLHGLTGVTAHMPKRQLGAIVGLALVVGILSPFVITNLDSNVYRKIIGVFLLAMIPILLFKKLGRTSTHATTKKQTVGYVLLAPALALQGIFGAGMGTLVNMILMGCMGMSALEASATKRYSQVVLNVVIVIGVLASHLIVWSAALVGIVCSAFGAYAGTKLAVRRGNDFVIGVLILLTVASAHFLLFS
jgi:uncharacterized membrane protein YfcA